MNSTDLDVFNLKEQIKQINKISNKDWIKSLSQRKLKELEFHDKDRDKQQIQTLNDKQLEHLYGNKKYYKVTDRSTKYMNDWIIRESKDKIFLDYACGNGENAIKSAKSGSKLSLGFDISSVSVKNAASHAQKENLNNTIFFQADAENTMLPDNSIDSIICCGMLHHLDLSYAFPEIRRVLKPGGKLLAYEALDYNPAIKIYRKLTPQMRTDWEKEHILSMKDIKFASNFFDIGEIKYWHVLGYLAGKFPFLYSPLNFLDTFIEKVPLVQRMSWIFTFELINSKET